MTLYSHSRASTGKKNWLALFWFPVVLGPSIEAAKGTGSYKWLGFDYAAYRIGPGLTLIPCYWLTWLSWLYSRGLQSWFHLC
jgi:hypothetical protein